MNKVRITKIALFALLIIMTMGGCVKNISSTELTSIEPSTEPTNQTKPVEEPSKGTRKDGERFEETIILEGMEEIVKYEHVKNEIIGFEIDYDYESFVRQSEQNKEKFVSIYDNLKNPENYLEITSSNEDVDTAANSIIDILSKDYQVVKESFKLNKAGNCIRIDASADKDGIHMPDLLQMVYIIPAKNGSIIGTAHYAIEAPEGFGRRFTYIMHTLNVIK